MNRDAARHDDERVGLCARCEHARRVEAPRALYWMCRRSLTDARYEKYPRLPVQICPGFEPRPEDASP